LNVNDVYYEVIYCDSKFWDMKKPLIEQVERTFRWYLIECPAIGIKDFNAARERAKKLKARFKLRAQIVIIGVKKNQYKKRTADDLLGITVLRGSHATECQAPEIIFTKSNKPVFYSRQEDLGYGRFPPTL